ncbi:hypothetical protein [Acinetobacter bohemicus]|uniref:hypothetical protein n=1 Tax=Acinetobacter bohemicus TaxID=1435036 RepID=UPI003FA203EB
MNYIDFMKKNLVNLPYSVGNIVAKIPYGIRPFMGEIYKKRIIEINQFDKYNAAKKKDFIFNKVKYISMYAYDNIPFYNDFYNDCNFKPVNLKSYDDVKEIPVINKLILQDVPLEYRSNYKLKKSLANTGGSSGKPFAFYIEPSSVPHEWAHMHHVWANLAYKQSHLKIMFGGRSDIENVVSYDSIRHQLTVDIYKPFPVIADHLFKACIKYNPVYLHGYPSAIFDLIFWLNENHHPLLTYFKNNIKGMFLGSELPSPIARNNAEQLVQCSSISWYGHTERCILAYEKNKKYSYTPFHTYGFVETICIDNAENLVGTSYYNMVSPLIRYNTEDIVIPTYKENILDCFEISEGRSGEYILDKNNNKIYLTGFIFGRHHKIFDCVKHIQVHQSEPGYATIYFSSKNIYSDDFINSNFDSSNIDIIFSYKFIPEPVKTSAGKVPLMLKNIS